MSEYKRWISYIYNYDRGVKSTTAGYVRIESRVGKCRMTVNIKGGIAMGETLKMFVFYRDGADIILVEAGQAGFYNGICDFCASTVVDNVFGSGMNIEQMSGVIAYSTLDRFYGSQWDDKAILLRRLIMHESHRDNVHESGVIEINGEPVDVATVKEYLGENDPAKDSGEDLSGAVEESEDKRDEQGTGPDGAPAVDDIEDINCVDDDSDVDAQVQIEENGNDDAGMCNEMYEENEPMSAALSRIFSRMPGMYPFEDDDIIECVKFDPQDIGMFPMEKWQLASNSFLLHGYYTYRHLIFARRRTVAGIKCMLGVPGMFRDREKFMAGMFGFGNFKGIRGKQNPGYGEFGYWYMDIDMK